MQQSTQLTDSIKPDVQILWADACKSKENISLNIYLKNTYPLEYFNFEEFQDLLNHLKNTTSEKTILVTNSSIGTKLLETNPNFKIIFYCGGIQYHIKCFNSPQVTYMIDSGSEEVKTLIKLQFQELNSQVLLQRLFNPQVLQVSEYTHSQSSRNLSFFIRLEFIKNLDITDNLLLKEMDQWVVATKKSDFQKALKKQFDSPFQKLIYCYSENFIYSQMNISFASNKFEEFKYVLNTLFHGFQSHDFKKNITLYRGISFNSLSDFLRVTKSLLEGKISQETFYWTHLVSTSTSQDVARRFAQQNKLGLLFTIHVQEYPAIQPPNDWFKYKEQEVLLFPQFPFQVEEVNTKDYFFFEIMIKEVKTTYNFTFDFQKRVHEWITLFTEKIRPLMLQVLTFHQWRLNFTIDKFQYFSLKLLNEEIQNYLKTIQETFLEIFQGIKNIYIRKSIILLIIEIKQIVILKEPDVLQKIKNLKKQLTNIQELFITVIIEILFCESFKFPEIKNSLKLIMENKAFNLASIKDLMTHIITNNQNKDVPSEQVDKYQELINILSQIEEKNKLKIDISMQEKIKQEEEYLQVLQQYDQLQKWDHVINNKLQGQIKQQEELISMLNLVNEFQVKDPNIIIDQLEPIKQHEILVKPKKKKVQYQSIQKMKK